MILISGSDSDDDHDKSEGDIFILDYTFSVFLFSNSFEHRVLSRDRDIDSMRTKSSH